MQETGTGNVEAPPPARRALTPLAAVGVAAFAILLGAGLIMAAADEGPKSRTADGTNPGTAPADAEAEVVEDLEALLELKDRAFDSHNVDLLAEVYADGAPPESRARKALKGLIRDDVHDDSAFETKSIEVQRLSPTVALVERSNLVFPCFRSSEGQDITRAGGVLEERVLYTLRKEFGAWQISQVELVEERVLIREKSSCARV
jgi:hypothetical protein